MTEKENFIGKFNSISGSNENNMRIIVLPSALTATTGGIEAVKMQFEGDLAEGHLQFIADATELGFMDYPALGLFIIMLVKVKEKGGEFWIKNLHGWSLGMFEENSLRTVFSLELGKDIRPAIDELLVGTDIPGVKIMYKPIDDVGVFSFSGKITNIDAMKRLKQELLMVLLEKKKFILDFKHLLFLPSFAIDAIIRIYRLLKISGAEISICNPNEIVKELLTSLDLHAVIPLYPSLDGAVAKLSGR
jgi:anti-anti-sigma factor